MPFLQPSSLDCVNENREGTVTKKEFVPLDFKRLDEDTMLQRSESIYVELKQRRTVRHFSPDPVPRAVIENCLLAAGTAPNGANLQPWHFAVVEDPEIKYEIRIAAEREEAEFYHHRAPSDWLQALEPFGTDEHKPFLEEAPVLIAIFEQKYGILPDGSRRKHYYTSESTGIATGMLISSLHHAGLATLTHTPSPMGFLAEILERPNNERPFLLLVVGYPAADAQVPLITKKKLEEITSFH